LVYPKIADLLHFYFTGKSFFEKIFVISIFLALEKIYLKTVFSANLKDKWANAWQKENGDLNLQMLSLL
jgi:hypothetical protein